MAVDPVPYVVHGAKHSADVFRQGFHDSTGGASGVSLPNNLHVKQTGTPSNRVQVAPGGAIIANSYQGGTGQSYGLRNAATTLVDVPASGSTGSKSWKIVFRVSDPQFGGQAPADPLVGPYVFLECVAAASVISAPHIVLADVVVPASTATITNAMITDRRKVAIPKVLDVWRFKAIVSGDEEILVTDDVVKGEYFPNNGGPQMIDIPEWATRVLIDVDWVQTRFAPGNAWGQVWVEYGPYAGASLRERSTQRMQWDTGGSSTVSRGAMKVVDDVYVPAAYRGTTQMFVPKATRVGGANNTVSMDAMSAMSMKVRFQNVADPSTS